MLHHSPSFASVVVNRRADATAEAPNDSSSIDGNTLDLARRLPLEISAYGSINAGLKHHKSPTKGCNLY